MGAPATTCWTVTLPGAEADRLVSRSGPLYGRDGRRTGSPRRVPGGVELDPEAFAHLRGLNWPHDDYRIERDGGGYLMAIGRDTYPVVPST